MTETAIGYVSPEYLSCAETAKLIRGALKRSFPGQKFSVRSRTYAGGASIDVSWDDGPLDSEVSSVVRAYNGADFDGMVDLKTYNDHWLLPDGSVSIAHRGGSVSYSEVVASAPAANARLVSLGANFIFTQRHVSEEFKASLIERFETLYRLPYEPEWEYEERLYGSDPPRLHHHGFAERGSTLLYRLAHNVAAT